MSVELSPEELGFRRPFNHEVTQVLRIANPNASGPVAFKVKTTAPKQYCVRPNSGIIKPNDAVDVQVLLQAMKEDPPLEARCRDKFLVQSVQIDDADDSNVAGLWSTIEKTNKSSIQEKKIRVSFLPPVDSATPRHLNGAHEDEPPSYSPGPAAYGSPAPDSKSTSAPSAQSPVNSAAAGISGAAAAVASAVPTSQAELKQQLDAAQARIKDLSNQLADPQLRQRKVAEVQEKVQTVVQQSQNSGVPLHIVAVLCLVSFLIAYLFF